MNASVLAFDWLAAEFDTTTQRFLVTVGTVVALVGVIQGVRRLARWLGARTRPLYADILGAVTLVVSSILAVAVILGVWDQTGEIRDLWSEYNLGGETVALLVVSAVVAMTAYIVTRFVKRLLDDILGSSSSVTDHQREVTYRMSQVVIYAMATVTVLGIWIDDLGAIFVGAGFLGIVMGMAAQQTLGSLLAGFVLMFSRPFEIGDWVVLDDEYEGIVTDISMINTRIRSFDDEYVIIPNDVVSASAVTNRSRSGRLRLEVEVGIDYDADVERARAIATSAVEEIDEIRSPPEPATVTKSFDDSAVLLGVRFWIGNPTRQKAGRTRTAAIEAITDAFESEGIKIPFPQRELSGREETGGFRVEASGLAYDEKSRTEQSDHQKSGSGGEPDPDGDEPMTERANGPTGEDD
ncbi:mechanosensitive ion channel family protein [Halovivax gelatinilyticus]|uniref:mechanosensitive ion channel family protein n=1 Tax=Halovivax gelatinilyticus TaxID=2961597 RepID=UPI0020CA588F|nr:mechanosensitive ion channel family protein [Halovivax gelatinilyticus]